MAKKPATPTCPKCKDESQRTEELSSHTMKGTLWGCNNCGHTFRVKRANDAKPPQNS